MKNHFKYPGFLEVSKFWQLFVFVLNCLLFPYSFHFLFEGCTLRVCWLYTHHTPAAACGLCCGELVGCEAQSMAAMLLCLKSKFFKVTEMFKYLLAVSTTEFLANYVSRCPNGHNIMHRNCNPKIQTVVEVCSCHTASVWICWIIQISHTQSQLIVC